MFRFRSLWLCSAGLLLSGCALFGAGEEVAVISEPEPGKGYVEDFAGLDLEMVWVPGGTFQMGSRLSPEEVSRRYGGPAAPPEMFEHEHPLHTVTLDGFWMSKCEVTNAQFRRFQPSHDSEEHEGLALDEDNQPVVHVTWDEAKSFCDWLSRESGRDYTFPTEAQWEYACRAGTDTVRFWGDDDAPMGRYANVADRTAESAFGESMNVRREGGRDYVVNFVPTTDGYKVAAPVGSLEPNQFGLCDMIGNVIEYCLDWYSPDYYANSPEKNPINLTLTEKRSCRGGSWLHLSFMQRAAYRGTIWTDHRSARVGFRVVRNPSEPVHASGEE